MGVCSEEMIGGGFDVVLAWVVLVLALLLGLIVPVIAAWDWI